MFVTKDDTRGKQEAVLKEPKIIERYRTDRVRDENGNRNPGERSTPGSGRMPEE